MSDTDAPDPDLVADSGTIPAEKLAKPPKRRRPSGKVIAALIVGFAVVALGLIIVPGMLGPSQAEKDAAEEARVEAEEQAEAAEQAQADYLACEATLGETADALSVLDTKLDSGLPYDDYEKAVTEIEDMKPTLLPGEVSEGCESSVYEPMEKARTAYAEAEYLWNGCIYDSDMPDCDTVEPRMQDEWWTASVAVEKMNEGRAAMRDAVDTEEAEADDAETEAEEAEAVIS